MNDTVAEIEITGAALREALGRMAKLGRGTPGLGTWTLGRGGLEIAWMGMAARFDGVGHGAAVMVINGPLMRGLARVKAWPAAVRVVARDGALQVGPMAFDAERRDAAPPQLLALNATPKDLVQLHVREPAEVIERGGLTADVAAALARLDQSCATAAGTLGWLGVTADDIRQWIVGRLGHPVAPAEPQVLVVEATGQVRLFDEP